MNISVQLDRELINILKDRLNGSISLKKYIENLISDKIKNS